MQKQILSATRHDYSTARANFYRIMIATSQSDRLEAREAMIAQNHIHLSYSPFLFLYFHGPESSLSSHVEYQVQLMTENWSPRYATLHILQNAVPSCISCRLYLYSGVNS